MVNFDDFLKEFRLTANEQSLSDVERFLTNLNNLLGNNELSTSLLDKEFVCKTFFLQKASSVVRSNYQKFKAYLSAIATYYNIEVDIPTHEEVLASREINPYFKDLDDVMSFIDEVGIRYLPAYKPNKELFYIKSIVILGWYGLDAREIVSIQRDDLSFSLNGCVVKLENKQLEIPNPYAIYLSLLQNEQTHRAIPSGKLMVFNQASKQLFRTSTRTSSETKENGIVKTIQRFNQEVPSYIKRAIVLRNLYKNAKFVDVLKDETSDSLFVKINKHLQCEDKTAIGYKREYEWWLNLFYKN